MESASKTKQEEFFLKETRPPIGATKKLQGHEVTCSDDLVEQMDYIYVHVVKAAKLPIKNNSTGSCSPYVEVKLGDYKVSTRHVEKEIHPKWDQIFAFSKSQVQAQIAELVIKDKAVLGDDDFIGKLPAFDLYHIPKCNRQNHLAPQWYRLIDEKGQTAVGELLLAIWMGTQADQYFPQAWHSDAASMSGEYILPKLWYLRVNIVDIPLQVRVLAVLGIQSFRTRTISNTNRWNEELLFVAAEPFVEQLVLTVEEVGELGRCKIRGRCIIPLQDVERRLDYREVKKKWYSLSRKVISQEHGTQDVHAGNISLRICLEGGHHVFKEPTDSCTDLNPAGEQLCRAAIGVLELGIISAHELMPMKRIDDRRRTDAYCVAKYGMKWFRTRTIIDDFNPKWNERHLWEVIDPFTVITIAVFDDYHFHGYRGAKDSKMGKVKIRVSSLESGKIYRHIYPLLVLQSSGVEKMGEIELTLRFTCTSWINMLQLYSRPLLPEMHYIYPLTVWQLNTLRDVAVEKILNQLGEVEPPLRKEVVDYLLDVDTGNWSLRKSKANFLRVKNFLRWFDQICKWEKPFWNIFIQFLLTTLLFFPKLLPSTILFSLFLIGIWNYKQRRAWHPPHMESHLSLGDIDDHDILDEEFDTFPTSQPSHIVTMRYDRLRSIGTTIQSEAEKWAALGERLQSLATWTDPRATAVFLPICIFTSVLFYLIEFRVIAAILGFYLLRHPWLRIINLHSMLVNFFTRLPTKVDHMLH